MSKFRIPQNLSEITLEQYQKYCDAVETIENEMFLQDTIISILCDITIQDLRGLTLKEIQVIALSVSNVVSKFSDEEMQFYNRFTLNGVEYGFIPNLNEISYGENKDIVTYMAEGVKSYHKAMAVLYRPILKTSNDTYSISEYKVPNAHESALKEMPVSVVLGAIVFFWSLTKELLQHIPSSFLKQEEMGELQQMMKKEYTNTTGEHTMKSTH